MEFSFTEHGFTILSQVVIWYNYTVNIRLRGIVSRTFAHIQIALGLDADSSPC